MTTSHPTYRRDWRHALGQAVLAMYFAAACFLIVFVLSGVLGMLQLARTDRTRLDIQSICMALKFYRKTKGQYPTPQEGLGALVSIQALEQLPLDSWNREYHYVLLQNDWPIVWSNGADGVPGGEGTDADLYNVGPLPPWLNESAPLPSRTTRQGSADAEPGT
jgi:general secretion pathway protein G